MTNPIAPTQKISNIYFSQETEDAIISYNNTDDICEKNKLYHQFIYDPLKKIVVYTLYQNGYYYAGETHQEIINDALHYLLWQLSKYKQENGKAFSYFTIITRNYLAHENEHGYNKKVNQHSIDTVSNSIHDDSNEYLELNKLRNNLFYDFIYYIEHNYDKIFSLTNDLVVCEAIIMLLKNMNKVNNFNKKALFFQVKEISRQSSQRITKVFKHLKVVYRIVNRHYLNTGFIDYEFFPETLIFYGSRQHK